MLIIAASSTIWCGIDRVQAHNLSRTATPALISIFQKRSQGGRGTSFPREKAHAMGFCAVKLQTPNPGPIRDALR